MRTDVASLSRVGLSAALCLLSAFCAIAKTLDSPDGMWIDLADTDLNSLPAKAVAPETIVRPTAYRSVWLDEAYLDEMLRFAPMEDASDRDQFAKSAVTLWLPMPDGSNIEFAFVESLIMEPELAEKFPEIKTYAGRSLDGRNLFVRFDRTPKGFHAMILGGATVYIDPYKQEGVYVSYFKHEYPLREEEFSCDFVGLDVEEDKGGSVLPLHGDTLRTYRLAVACTGEFANFHGATTPETKGNAVSAIATTVNRVNGIYESELAVRLTLIGQNSELVFVDPATDPFPTGANADTLIAKSQEVIGGTVQALNYDIGHTVATTGAGLAEIRSVCKNGIKAMGVTGIPSPVGDPFDVDFVAHEIGHQFGADHPFNGKKKKCKKNRNASTAYERGSGTTIMSYAGICGGDNITSHSDAFFHSESLREIQAYITNQATCQTETATNNLGPIIDAGADYTIPKKTAFVLTATADDQEGDPLSYSWEERDLGPAQFITDPDNGKSPLFRCFPPKLDAWRMFPELLLVLGGNANYNDLMELLPAENRTMTFWVVGRDGRGGFGSDETKIRVASSAGPFKVTYPNTPVVITGDTKKTVKWDVASTNLSPISTSNVRISLSVDGGVTFPTVLKDNTPNDGREKVKFPKVGTLSGRVKVEAVNNVYFDISDRDFAIDAGFSLVGTWIEIDTFTSQPFTRLVFDADTVTRCYAPSYTSCQVTDSPYTFEDFDDPVYTKKLSIPAVPIPDNVWYCKIIDNNTIETYYRTGLTTFFQIGTLQRQ